MLPPGVLMDIDEMRARVKEYELLEEECGDVTELESEEEEEEEGEKEEDNQGIGINAILTQKQK